MTPEPPSPPALFERLAAEGMFERPDWLLQLRRAAMARFAARGYPTPDDEDWRYTSVAPVTALPFRPALHLEAHRVEAVDLNRFTIPDLQAHQLVFIDGHFAGKLSRVLPEAGVQVSSLAERLAADDPLVREHLCRLSEGEENPFVALNTALFQDGAVIHVEKGVTPSPIHLIFLNTAAAEGLTVHARNLVILSPGSRVTLLESFHTLGTEPALTNAVIEMFAGADANIDHIRLQQESDVAVHMGAVLVEAQQHAVHWLHSMALGARLSRTSIHEILAGEHVEGGLHGLYVLRDEQVADHHMIVEHARPHGVSHEHFHGILAGRSRGVFHGRIRVHPGAQKTDAKQTNRNLLLSDEATIDTKPQLEIYADDVKCTHGATVGQLNDEAIFYLRSRGIGFDKARRMLIHAFADEVLERIRFTPVREHLDRLIWDQIERLPDSAEAAS